MGLVALQEEEEKLGMEAESCDLSIQQTKLEG